MADTPEGKVKKQVNKLLADSKRFGYIYQYWPVPAGYGDTTLDCLLCYRGVFIGVETKARGKRPTPRQNLCIEEIVEAGGVALVIDPTNVDMLEKVLVSIRDCRPAKKGAYFTPGSQDRERDPGGQRVRRRPAMRPPHTL